jgi:hypothetical protein
MLGNKKLFTFTLFLWLTGISLATTFVPTPFEKQVMDSYGVIRGTFSGLNYKKLSSGEVVTQASFQVKESAGLKPNEVVNKNDFKIIYPGGKWQGVVYQVQGAPTFEPGEDVVLLLSKGEHGFSVKSLALGKYNVRRKNSKFFLTSSVFSKHPKLGKIKYKDFEEIVSHRFGSRPQNIKDDRFVYKAPIAPVQRKAFASLNRKKQGRKIASVEEVKTSPTKEASFNILWLVFLFGFMGTYSLKKLAKKRKR